MRRHVVLWLSIAIGFAWFVPSVAPPSEARSASLGISTGPIIPPALLVPTATPDTHVNATNGTTSTTAACPDFVAPAGVGVEDLQLIAGHWRQDRSDQGWDDRFDRDGNGRIEVTDIMQVAVLWHGICPSSDDDAMFGRISRLPASWFYKTTLASTTGLRVRTICYGDCDTGLIVVIRGEVWYNDDHASTGGNGQGSYICATCPYITTGGTETVDVYVFSQPRATSHAVLQVNRGHGWEHVTTQRFGGTLVNVGPLHAGDFIEVQTINKSNGGAGNDNDTHMILFDMDSPQKGLLYSNNISGSDWDPRIPITDGNWMGPNNYVLIGKIGRSTASNLGVEARVDLVHGPLDTDYAEAAFPTEGGASAPITLQPGRYYAWMFARTSLPVGELNVNPSNDMPHDFCPDYYRGVLNGPAFTLHAERLVETVWQAVTSSRKIPKGAMGSEAGHGWNLFLVELNVDTTGTFRLVTQHDVPLPSTTFFSEWRLMRNPDASEITVASYNTLHDHGDYDEEKIKNASNLIATRGSVFRSTVEVEERADQAPWQWEADVIGLQELRKGADSSSIWLGDTFEYADIFQTGARSRGSRDWQYVRGEVEDWDFSCDFGTKCNGVGPLFIADNVWPGPNGDSIYFDAVARDHAGCEPPPPVPTPPGWTAPVEYAQCWLEGLGGITKSYNYAVPGKAVARRYGSSPDRPVAVFNSHLEHAAEDSDHRREEIDELMSTIDRLLDKDPDAFNSDTGNPDRRNPKFHQNRIIVLGDSNFMTHACGEHYWIQKRLRDHYGYAIDVSMVSVVDGNHFGMHDRMGVVGGAYQSAADWRAAPDYSDSSTYPWWAATFRGKTAERNGKGDRHDVIFLVGKGWAYDDPVRAYMVMSDRDDPSPMNPGGGGVEMWRASTGSVTDGNNNYAPNYSLGYGTSAGKPALHSDHQPVGAILRVFLR